MHNANQKHLISSLFFFLCLAAAGLALPTTAVATITPINSSSSGEITITGAEEGVEANLYNVLIANFDETTQQPKDPVYTWAEATQEWLIDNYANYIESDGTVANAFYDITDSEAAKFYQDFASAIKGGNIALSSAGTASASASGTIFFNELSIGSYLVIIENGLYVYSPLLLNIVPTWDDSSATWVIEDEKITAEVKAEQLSIEKGVATSTDGGTSSAVATNIGATLYYTITANVPTYPSGATATTYAIGDVMSDGLALNSSSIDVYGYTGSSKTLLTEGSEYELTTSNASLSDGTALTFLLTFTYSEISNYDTIVVTYSATVTSVATAGTSLANDALLEYSNNPYNTETSEIAECPTEVLAYVYGFMLTKVDATDASTVLSGAQFNIANEEGTILSFIQTDTGTYRLAQSDEAGVTILDATNGTLSVSGLTIGTYILTETCAPDGYSLPSDSITFTIQDSDLNGAPTLNTDATEYETGFVLFDIPNTPASLFTLPKTGSYATIALIAAGIACMAGAAVAYTLKRIHRRNPASTNK